MATSILFGSRLINIPGVYTEIDASGLAQVGLSATGVVAVIGEAEGGSPYNGATPVYTVTNPAQANRLFRDGDLREAANMIFDPSLDPDIQGGAQALRIVKVNPATQSELTLSNADGPALKFTAKDYGLFTTRISVSVADGTSQGKAVTISLEGLTETFDNLGGDSVFSLEYTPGSAGATTMVASLNPGTAFAADFTKTGTGRDADYDGALAGVSGLDGDADNSITNGSTVDVASSSTADTTQTVTIYGIDSSSSLPATETLTLNGTTTVAGSTTWSAVHGILLSAACAGTVTATDNGDSDTLFDIAPAALSAGINVFDSELTAGGATISVAADAASTAQVLVIGTAAGGTPTVEAVTLSGTTPVVTTAAWESISALGLGLVAAARTVALTGLLLEDGASLTVVSSNAADAQTGVVYGLDGAGSAQSAAFTLNGTSAVAVAGTWSKVLGITLSSAPSGTVALDSVDESITIFEVSGQNTTQGFVNVNNLPVSGAVTAVLNGAGTGDILVVGKDANQAAILEKVTLNGATPVAGAITTWSEVTGLALGHVAAARTVTLSGKAFNITNATADTVGEVTDIVAALPGFDVTTNSTVRNRLMSAMDTASSQSVLSAEVDFTANNAAIIEQVNAASTLVTAAAASGATGAPSNTATAAFLAGGIEGTTTFADWQAALDLLREEQVNTIVVLTSDEAVHAAVAAHCRFMAGDGRRERDAILGAASGETLAQLKARAVALNTRHCRLAIQDITRFNLNGVREQFPPYFTACIAAGMQAGSPVGEPLTFKLLNVLGVRGNDATYTTTDSGSELIDSGLMVIQQVPNVGFRWLRNVTTHLIDDNIAFVEASANEAVNFSIFNLRTALEAVVGKKGNPNTLNAALSIAVASLNAQVDAGALTTWRNLTLALSGDVLQVDVEVAPVLPTNFVPVTVHLVGNALNASA